MTHEKLKKEITKYLIDKYCPETIILHGSRASDNYREHSDWDIFVFIQHDSENVVIDREVFKEQAMDITIANCPDIKKSILDKLVAVCHSIEVVYDKDKLGTSLVKSAIQKRSEGLELSGKDKELIIIEMFKDINNLEDLQGDDGVFFFRLGRDFFRNALNGWFRIIRREYSLPPYLSIPYIKEQDPEYYSLLEILWSNKNNNEKVQAANLIFRKIKESASYVD